MAFQQQGFSGNIPEVDLLHRAMRVSGKPIDHGSLGHYRLATTVALVVTQNANGTLFSFRWGDATRFAVLLSLKLKLIQTAAATATIWPSYQAFVARGFTVSDSVGTAITLTGNNMKRRTSGMGTTLVTDIRKSAVAAGLTAGTRTLDAEPFLEMLTTSTITTPNANLYQSEMESWQVDGQYPLVLAQNEGFIIRGPTTAFGAAGTANLSVEATWVEVTAF